MGTRFLFNQELWREIQKQVDAGRRVRAAIAYFGSDGAKLLPLKKGDNMVVDLTIGAVRQGVTNPSEIRTLIKRGVNVFSRGSLHAKFLLVDRTLIASSANVSKNSKQILDEAGIVTSDPAAVRRASDFFDKLCTEPVGREYLKKCIAEYRPPKFKPAVEHRQAHPKRSRRILEAKLWFVGGLVALSLKDEDLMSIERVERRFEKQLSRPEQTEVSWIRYSRALAFLQKIRVGDWIVDCMKDGRTRYVGPPKRALGVDWWTSNRRKRYRMLMLEEPSRGEPMPLTQFRRKIAGIQPELNRSNPRTRPIVDNDRADEILRLWTAGGKIARRRIRR